MSVFAWIVLVVLIGAGAIWIRDIVKFKGRTRRTRVFSRPGLLTAFHLVKTKGDAQGIMLLDQAVRHAHEREAKKLAD